MKPTTEEAKEFLINNGYKDLANYHSPVSQMVKFAEQCINEEKRLREISNKSAYNDGYSDAINEHKNVYTST